MHEDGAACDRRACLEVDLPRLPSIRVAVKLVPDLPAQIALAVAGSSGHLLVFPLAELPQLAKGKGNRLIALAPDKGERVAALALLPAGAGLMLVSGKRRLKVKIEDHLGERGRRGVLVGGGKVRIDALEVSGAG